MKAENTTKIQFDSLSVNEAYARGAAAAFLARYDPTVPQLADLKTAVSEAVTNAVHCSEYLVFRNCLGDVSHLRNDFVGSILCCGKQVNALIL